MRLAAIPENASCPTGMVAVECIPIEGNPLSCALGYKCLEPEIVTAEMVECAAGTEYNEAATIAAGRFVCTPVEPGLPSWLWWAVGGILAAGALGGALRR